MRTETILVSERDLTFAVAGQLFDQCPNRQPRNAEIIMTKLRDSFRSEAFNDNEWYTVRVEADKLYDWLNQKLVEIPEFVDLNLSQIEFENHVSVDDPNRPKFKFTSQYDVETSESWKDDFVDLDAFVSNVHRNLFMRMDAQEDCFLCTNQDATSESTLSCGSSDECKRCSINPNLTNNYKCRRYPKGKYTFACKYDCVQNKYICCEECGSNQSCNHRCDGSSETCGNAIRESGADDSVLN